MEFIRFSDNRACFRISEIEKHELVGIRNARGNRHVAHLNRIGVGARIGGEKISRQEIFFHIIEIGPWIPGGKIHSVFRKSPVKGTLCRYHLGRGGYLAGGTMPKQRSEERR